MTPDEFIALLRTDPNLPRDENERGDLSVAPKDAIRWVLWKRLREPGFAPQFPYTLKDLDEIAPDYVAAIDAAFLPSKEIR